MKIALFKTEKGAEGYAAALRKQFPAREFRPVSAGFEYAVGVFSGKEMIAYARRAPRRKFGAKAKAA